MTLPNPLVYLRDLNIQTSDFENLTSEAELLKSDLPSGMNIPGQVLNKYPEMLRKAHFKLAAILGKDRVIDIASQSEIVKINGIAIDVGSTTLAVGMLDLVSGKTIAIEMALNPQTRYGDDLISRINYVTQNKNAELVLKDVLLTKINLLIHKIYHDTGLDKGNVYACVVSGNAVMNHLFLGINPRSLGFAPFEPVFHYMNTLSAEETGLDIHPQAEVHIMPNIGGYVGGDIVSDLICAGFGKKENKIKLLIDIGTNCEVVLEHSSGRFAASSPAGPALEGANIRFGMRAESGAIFDIDHDGNLKTIRDKPVRGICGSGLFHLVEKLHRSGAINDSGLIETKVADFGFLVQEFESNKAFLLNTDKSESGRNVYLTQSDIREFQLARSAIITAWEMLAQLAGIQPSEIDDVYIAGAFGNFIRPEAAISLGLVPLSDVNKIHFIGNASMEGSRLVLGNSDLLAHARMLTDTTQFVELAGKPEFQDLFVENLRLG